MTYLDRITFNAEQCGGRPCIRGMRVRVKDVLDLLAAGLSEEEFLRIIRIWSLKTSGRACNTLRLKPAMQFYRNEAYSYSAGRYS